MIDKDWFSVFLIRLLLATSGIRLQNDKLRYLNHPISIIFFNLLSLILMTTFLYLQEYDQNVIWIMVNNLVHWTNYCATFIIVYRNKDSFIQIMDALKINIYQYPPNMLKFKPNQVPSVLTIFIIFILFHVAYFVILLLPAMHEFLTKTPPSIGGLMYPCWYPWTVDTQIKYVLTYMLQFTGAILSCGFMPINILFVVHIVFLIQEQSDILYTVLQNVKAHDASETVAESDNQRELQFHFNLMECMKHHSAIIRFINHFVSCYKWIFVLNLLYSTMVFTINCYILIAGDHDMAKFMQTIFELSLVFPYFFVYCYIGEVFKDVNIVLKDLIYDINWYDKSIKFRKTILILLSMTTQEINLKFSQKLVASYMLLASVLKASYTYANLMLNMHKELN